MNDQEVLAGLEADTAPTLSRLSPSRSREHTIQIYGSTNQHPSETRSRPHSPAPTQADDEAAPLLSSHPHDNQTESNGDDYGDFKESPWYRRPSVFRLLPVFALFTMAFGAVAVPRLNIILELICREYLADKHLTSFSTSGNEPTCQENADVQQLVARFVLYTNVISGALSVITSPRLGSLSDRYGRRSVLALSSLGLLTTEITTVLAAKFPNVFSVNFILLGSVLDGISGGFLLGISIAQAYAADCTSIASRAVSFGYFQGALFSGIALGPALGGYIIKRSGNVFLVFYLAIAAHAAFILYIALVLPESLSERKLEKAREKHARAERARREEVERLPKSVVQRVRGWNPFGPLNILRPVGTGSSARLRANLAVLVALDLLFFGASFGAAMVVIMYAEYKFKWLDYESSIFVSIVNSTRTAVLFLVIPLLTHIVRKHTSLLGHSTSPTPSPGSTSQLGRHIGATTFDMYNIRFAIVAQLAGYFGYALSKSASAFTLSGMLTALGGIGSPTIQSCMTKHVPSDRVGQLLGATALLHSMVRVVAPAVFSGVYSATVKSFPQAVFVCLGGVFFVAGCFSWFVSTRLTLFEDGEGNMVDCWADGEVYGERSGESGGERGGE